MAQENPALLGLPEPGEPVFYPKLGHCIYRGVTQDRAAPGTELLELEDLEEGSRILIPLARVPQLNLRPAGRASEEIKRVLSSEFEEPIEDEDERHALTEQLIVDGSPEALSRALKQLHLLRQTEGLDREEELTRKKIRSWLAAEVSLSRDCTRAEAQAFMTRVLQESLAEHERKEKEEAKERRRAARQQRKAEEASSADALAPAQPDPGIQIEIQKAEMDEPETAQTETAGTETAGTETAGTETAETETPDLSETPELSAGASEPSAPARTLDEEKPL